MFSRVFGTLVGAVLGVPLVGIFAKSGRTLSIGVDKPVPRDFKCTKLRRAYRSVVFVRHSLVQKIIHRTYGRRLFILNIVS